MSMVMAVAMSRMMPLLLLGAVLGPVPMPVPMPMPLSLPMAQPPSALPAAYGSLYFPAPPPVHPGSSLLIPKGPSAMLPMMMPSSMYAPMAGMRYVAAAPPPVGEVMLALRPEQIVIALPGESPARDDEIGVDGTVTEVVYRGTSSLYLVEAAGVIVRVHRQNAGNSDFKPGESVRISWAAAAMRILPA